MSEYKAGDTLTYNDTEVGEVWSEAPYLFGTQAYWVIPDGQRNAVYVWREKKTRYRSNPGFVSSHDVTARLLNAERVPLYGLEARAAFQWRVFLIDEYGRDEMRVLGNRYEGLVAGKR